MIWDEVIDRARLANDHYSMSEDQQRMLWELAKGVPKGGLIVELGVCWGKTAIVLALAAKEQQATYRGIDNWSLEGSKKDVSFLMQTAVGAGDWWLMESDTHDEFMRAFDVDIDMLVIDAGHDEANVSQDCEVWIPKVVPGGIVVFDDVPSGPGWAESCHWAVRAGMEHWCADWEMAAAWGKTWCWRKPLAL